MADAERHDGARRLKREQIVSDQLDGSMALQAQLEIQEQLV